jgi:hypothetical protein
VSLHEKHMKLVDAVNNAKTEHEHYTLGQILHGWRDGVVDAGGRVDLCAADLEQFDRGFEHRPMCCGVFLDWEPKS